MNDLGSSLGAALVGTLRDVLPLAIVILGFQLVVLSGPIPHWRQTLVGFVLVVAGLGVFLVGLELGVFPLGEAMARQLAEPRFLGQAGNGAAAINAAPWWAYYWTYLFAFCIGFGATIAEPALIAVAIKASDVSGGTIHVGGLRVAVAIGSGLGVMLGAMRIVAGIPLPYAIIAGYLLVIVQTYFAPRQIVPLAYDAGGVTTSTVTVPLVAALGLGLAAQVPGRDPLIDGFGMIALAVMFPMLTVMGYAQLAQFRAARDRAALRLDETATPV